jgi:hypothetical protein
MPEQEEVLALHVKSISPDEIAVALSPPGAVGGLQLVTLVPYATMLDPVGAYTFPFAIAKN